jgi:DNA-binding transcriptional ArsR family regulator
MTDSPPSSPVRSHAAGTTATEPAIDPMATLSLLSDEYARDILEVLGDEPLPAREIHDRLDVSRATVYRRLERLESAGLVTRSTAVHPDGHHRAQFTLALDRIHVRFGHNGPTAAAA